MCCPPSVRSSTGGPILTYWTFQEQKNIPDRNFNRPTGTWTFHQIQISDKLTSDEDGRLRDVCLTGGSGGLDTTRRLFMSSFDHRWSAATQTLKTPTLVGRQWTHQHWIQSEKCAFFVNEKTLISYCRHLVRNFSSDGDKHCFNISSFCCIRQRFYSILETSHKL